MDVTRDSSAFSTSLHTGPLLGLQDQWNLQLYKCGWLIPSFHHSSKSLGLESKLWPFSAWCIAPTWKSSTPMFLHGTSTAHIDELIRTCKSSYVYFLTHTAALRAPQLTRISAPQLKRNTDVAINTRVIVVLWQQIKQYPGSLGPSVSSKSPLKFCPNNILTLNSHFTASTKLSHLPKKLKILSGTGGLCRRAQVLGT